MIILQVQIRPWNLSDSDFVMDGSQTLDPRKTIFVGGVPRPLRAGTFILNAFIVNYPFIIIKAKLTTTLIRKLGPKEMCGLVIDYYTNVSSSSLVSQKIGLRYTLAIESLLHFNSCRM